jgi:hypothetical protein
VNLDFAATWGCPSAFVVVTNMTCSGRGTGDQSSRLQETSTFPKFTMKLILSSASTDAKEKHHITFCLFGEQLTT